MGKRHYKKHYRKHRGESLSSWAPIIFSGVLLFYFFERARAAIVIIALMSVLLSYIIKTVRRRKYLKSSLYQVDHMSGEEFEKFLKAHFENQGYKVYLTPKSGDYGVDLVCREKGVGKEKSGGFVVQAKRYNDKVGISAVQQLIGGMHYYECDKGIVVTNSYFTSNAKMLAQKSNVELWDRRTIREKFKVKEGK